MRAMFRQTASHGFMAQIHGIFHWGILDVFVDLGSMISMVKDNPSFHSVPKSGQAHHRTTTAGGMNQRAKVSFIATLDYSFISAKRNVLQLVLQATRLIVTCWESEFPSEEVAFNNVGRWTHVKGSEHSGTIHVHITIPQSTDISLDEA